MLVLLVWGTIVDPRATEARTVVFLAKDDGRSAGGWGDRLKGILTADALARATERTLIIDSTHGWKLHDFYEGNWHPIFWRKSKSVLHIDCLQKPCEECFVPFVTSRWADIQSHDDLVYRGNYDCVDRLRLLVDKPLPSASEAFQELFDRPKFQVPAASTVWHVRFGGTFTVNGRRHVNRGQPEDNVVERGRVDPGKAAEAYWACQRRMLRAYNLPDRRPFVALDVDNAAVRKAFGDVEFGNGTMGHAEKHPPAARRTHVEFEMMRRANVLLLDDSGMSFMAYKTRKSQHQIAYVGATCTRPFENTVISLAP